MYFKKATMPKDRQTAIKRSLKKWREILAFCEAGELPDSFDEEDITADTCPLCVFYVTMEMLGGHHNIRKTECPLNFIEDHCCSYYCCESWRLFFRYYINSTSFTADNPYEQMRQPAKDICNLLQRALEE